MLFIIKRNLRVAKNWPSWARTGWMDHSSSGTWNMDKAQCVSSRFFKPVQGLSLYNWHWQGIPIIDLSDPKEVTLSIPSDKPMSVQSHRNLSDRGTYQVPTYTIRLYSMRVYNKRWVNQVIIWWDWEYWYGKSSRDMYLGRPLTFITTGIVCRIPHRPFDTSKSHQIISETNSRISSW